MLRPHQNHVWIISEYIICFIFSPLHFIMYIPIKSADVSDLLKGRGGRHSLHDCSSYQVFHVPLSFHLWGHKWADDLTREN